MKNGCLYWSDCCSCPYPDCIKDAGIRQKLREKRNKRIRKDFNKGMNTVQLGKKYKLAHNSISLIVK